MLLAGLLEFGVAHLNTLVPGTPSGAHNLEEVQRGPLDLFEFGVFQHVLLLTGQPLYYQVSFEFVIPGGATIAIASLPVHEAEPCHLVVGHTYRTPRETAIPPLTPLPHAAVAFIQRSDFEDHFFVAFGSGYLSSLIVFTTLSSKRAMKCQIEFWALRNPSRHAGPARSEWPRDSR